MRDRGAAAARDEEGSTRRKKMKKIRVEDPMDEIVCTNLKQWKMEKKKSSGRYIGLPGGSCVGGVRSWARVRIWAGALGHLGFMGLICIWARFLG